MGRGFNSWTSLGDGKSPRWRCQCLKGKDKCRIHRRKPAVKPGRGRK